MMTAKNKYSRPLDRTPLIMSMLLLSVAHEAHAFVPTRANYRPKIHNSQLYEWKDKGEASYSDNWLLNFHNQVQSDRILTTNSLAVWNEQLEQEQAQIRDWQDAFQRNNLADFTPPMTAAGMNCLLIGDNLGEPRNPNQRNHFQTKLPWEDEPEADITSLQVIRPDANDDTQESPSMIQTSLVSLPSTTLSNTSPNCHSSSDSSSSLQIPKVAAVYDCIVDQGLLGSVLDDPSQVRSLLLEAATALREHGIYVLSTSHFQPRHRTLLEELTHDCGLEWEFELDGISDETQQVSVARRFNAGAMPSVGKLSRYHP